MCLFIRSGPRGKPQTVPEPIHREGLRSFPAARALRKDGPQPQPSQVPAASGLPEARGALHLPFWSLEGSALLRRFGRAAKGSQCPLRTRTPNDRRATGVHGLPSGQGQLCNWGPGKGSSGVPSPKDPALTSCQKNITCLLDTLGSCRRGLMVSSAAAYPPCNGEESLHLWMRFPPMACAL